MRREIKKALDPLKRGIALMVGRAVMTAIDDSQARQYIQLSALKGETKDRAERVQEYGFTSVPLEGAQVIFVCLNGNRDHPIAISVDDAKHRPEGMESGDSALYTHQGTKVHLKADGKVLHIVVDDVVIEATNKVRMITPLLECTGEIRDRCDSDGTTMQHMREVYDIHRHDENDSGGPTDDPIEKMSP